MIVAIILTFSDAAPVVFFIFVLGVIIFGTLFTRKFDQRRIARDIESRGGRIIRIEGVRMWLENRYDRSYQVTYITPEGETITTTCRTSGSNGVYWIRESPPGFPAEGKAPGMYSNARAGDEPIQCPGCGTGIAANETRCRQCGWSYKQS